VVDLLCRLCCCHRPPVLTLNVEVSHNLVHIAAKHLVKRDLGEGGGGRRGGEAVQPWV